MSQPRKLATILALDVAGYSRAAEHDDEAAASSVRLLRLVITEIVTPYGGRIFSSAGDGFMLEFPAASSGAQAVMALLRESRTAARPLPSIRAGLHLGEVIVEENGDLLGHGVNVAARLMSLAEPGTAVVSEVVRSQVRAASELPFVAQGRVQLDKMGERIEVFSLNPGVHITFTRIVRRRALRPVMIAMVALVVMTSGFGAWMVWGPRPSPPPPLAERPLLAVLPFDAEKVGPEAERFAENVAGELQFVIGQSGRSIDLIGRTSSFSVRGADKTISNIRAQLKPTHVLDGKIAQDGEQVVYTLQLTDVRTGKEIWSERRNGPVSAMPSMLAHFSGSVLQALDVLSENDRGYADIDPEAMRLFLSTPCEGCPAPSTSFADQIDVLTRVVAMQPDFLRAWQRLAYSHSGQRFWAQTKAEVERSEILGKEAARRALTLAPDDPLSLALNADFEKDPAEFQKGLRRALAIDPTNSAAVVSLSDALGARGRFREAVEAGYTAAMLDPLNMTMGSVVGNAAVGQGDADRAEELLIRNKRSNLQTLPALVMAWLVDGKLARADAVLKILEERAGAGQKPQEVARRQIAADLRSLVTAAASGDRQALAAAARAIKPLKFAPGDPPPPRWRAIAFYDVRLPALARYAGADAAFELWSDRIKELPRINPERDYDRLLAEYNYLLWSVHYDVMAPLQQDRRYWRFVADHLTALRKRSPDLLAMFGGPRSGVLTDFIDANAHWPPDFCSAPDFPYDCTQLAREAFQAVEAPRPK